MVQPCGWMSTASSLALCVCVCSMHLSNTGILIFQDSRCLPFPLELSQAPFVSPVLPQVHRELPLLGVLSDPLKRYLSFPSNLWSLQKTEVWGQNSCQGCLACPAGHEATKMGPKMPSSAFFQSLIPVWVVTVSTCLVSVWPEDTQILSVPVNEKK